MSGKLGDNDWREIALDSSLQKKEESGGRNFEFFQGPVHARVPCGVFPVHVSAFFEEQFQQPQTFFSSFRCKLECSEATLVKLVHILSSLQNLPNFLSVASPGSLAELVLICVSI